MTRTSRILAVDDVDVNVRVLERLLEREGYEVVGVGSGDEALERLRSERFDLVLLDVIMPGMSGYEVCTALRSDPATRLLPVVMITGLDASRERIKGIEAGADDFLSKPLNADELVARVRSLLRIKELHDTVERQARQLADWSRSLEEQVRAQVDQLDRLARLKRFFSPQLAEAIVAGGTEDPLQTHRREVAVVFIDLRGYTAFSESQGPEEVMAVLREYHAEMGEIILAHEGTLERFAGDGMMVFFNDPVPIAEPAHRALRMALAMRERGGALVRGWRQRGYNLDFGIGIDFGPATIGAIGFAGRWDYGAIGTVTNFASRLCDEAGPGEILVSERIEAQVREVVTTAPLGPRLLKGFLHPAPIFRVLGARDPVRG